MKEAVRRYYEGLDYTTSKEASAGTSSHPTYMRYLTVDAAAYHPDRQPVYIECETRFSMKRFREKSTRLHKVRDRVRLALVVPESICRDHRWIWMLRGLYDQVMVYSEDKDRITKIHYLHYSPRKKL